MAFVKKTWKDRIAEFPTRRRLTKEDNTSELVTVAREEGTLSQEGDAFSAENMNDLENRIDAEFTALNGKLSTNEVEFLGQFTSANPNVTDTKMITDLSKYKRIALITYSNEFKYAYNPIDIPYALFKVYGNEIISYASNFFASMKYISDTQIGIRTNNAVAYIYGVK